MVLAHPENSINGGHSKVWEEAADRKGGCRTEHSKKKRVQRKGDLLVIKPLDVAL